MEELNDRQLMNHDLRNNLRTLNEDEMATSEMLDTMKDMEERNKPKYIRELEWLENEAAIHEEDCCNSMFGLEAI